MSKLTSVIPASLALFCGVARAEERDPEMQGPPTADPQRAGATITLAFGPGELHQVPDEGDATRTEGAAFSLRIGTMVAPTTAIELIADFVSGSSIDSAVFGGSVKFYPRPAIYARVGGGLGLFSRPGSGDDPTMDSGGRDRHTGIAGVFAVGWEMFQLRDIALFGELGGMGNRLTEENANTTIVNAHLVFGITWF